MGNFNSKIKAFSSITFKDLQNYILLKYFMTTNGKVIVRKNRKLKIIIVLINDVLLKKRKRSNMAEAHSMARIETIGGSNSR